jgi:hypothetical protein
MITQFDVNQFIAYLAIHAPAPKEWQMENERSRDRGLNPNNETHKPAFRTNQEIDQDLRIQYACALQLKIQSWSNK